MSDTSVRNQNGAGQRMADALLRATAGSTALLLMPALAADTSDGGQLGMDAPNFQQLELGPAAFRRTRAQMHAGDESRYELMLSATAVEQQVSALMLDSADALFAMASGVLLGAKLFEIEAWSVSEALGQAYLYRLQLRSARSQSPTSMS